MQDVDAYLRRRGVTLADYFDPERPAILDDEHQVRLNYETFFFADEQHVREFEADPIRFCGLLTDPVTKVRFRPAASAQHIVYEGVVYYFQTSASYDRFRRRPELYVLPGRWLV